MALNVCRLKSQTEKLDQVSGIHQKGHSVFHNLHFFHCFYFCGNQYHCCCQTDSLSSGNVTAFRKRCVPVNQTGLKKPEGSSIFPKGKIHLKVLLICSAIRFTGSSLTPFFCFSFFCAVSFSAVFIKTYQISHLILMACHAKAM